MSETIFCLSLFEVLAIRRLITRTTNYVQTGLEFSQYNFGKMFQM